MQESGLQWVIVDGEIQHVSDFSDLKPSARPEMRCPVCDQVVTSKLGNVRIHHAAHNAGSNCSATQPETVLHLNAKYHLRRELTGKNLLFYHQKCLGWLDDLTQVVRHSDQCKDHRKMVLAENWDLIKLEYVIGPYRADVALLKDGIVILVIEVHVTHDVDEDKKDYLISQNIPWVEVSVKNQNFYSGDKAWKVGKPLPVEHEGLSTSGTWICIKCQEQENDRKSLHKPFQFLNPNPLNNVKSELFSNHLKIYVPLIQFVDYYFPSGKTFREHFTTHLDFREEKQLMITVHNGYYRSGGGSEIGESQAFSYKEALKKASNMLVDYHKNRRHTVCEVLDSPMKWQPWHISLYGRFKVYDRSTEEIFPKRYIRSSRGWTLSSRYSQHRWDEFWENLADLTSNLVSSTEKQKPLVCIICGKLSTEYKFVDNDRRYCRCNECLDETVNC